jgi:hypothetical protein
VEGRVESGAFALMTQSLDSRQTNLVQSMYRGGVALHERRYWTTIESAAGRGLWVTSLGSSLGSGWPGTLGLCAKWGRSGRV